ncbi:MAG TPA: insulinase family protein [Longimicrobiaceae bacterium]|nr:insulinase family protein [Longimicrobiaceae bacterium]
MRRLLLPLLLLLLPGCALPRLGRFGRAPEPLPVDSQVIQGTLKNGLRYYVRVNHEPRDRAELRLVVDAGSVLEDEDQRGAAHFVEHMAFNGTTHFRKQALIDYLERVGMRFGADVNAYTSFDETVYMLTLPTDTAGVLGTGFQILEDWAHGLTFDSTEVEKERGVILEEWRLGRGAGARMQDAQFPVLAAHSRYAERDPIGTRASILSLRPSRLRRFYHDWYRPDLMAVVAVGDFDPQQILGYIHEHFDSLRGPAVERPRRDFAIPPHDSTVISVATDPEATGATVGLYVTRPPQPWHTVEDYREWMVQSIAGELLTDRLSERTQRPGSPFLDISSFQGRFLRPLSAYVLTARVPADGIARGLGQLITGVKRAARHGYTATEVERAKRQTLRRAEQRWAERTKLTSAGLAAEYASLFIYGGQPLGSEAEYDLTKRLLPRIGVRDVSVAARDWMEPENRVILVNAPRADSIDVPTRSELLRVVDVAERSAVTAYVDSISSAPLVPHPPLGGHIVTEQRFDSVGVTEWTLSNGVRVLLKPTDFRTDEVLIAGASPGGSSLYPDSDYVAALTASAVVQAGGAGELSSIELRKRLAGQVVGVGTDVARYEERVSGAASPLDLETLFQLVYLKFTAPRLDSAAIKAYRTQARDALAHRDASPETLFGDSLRVILAQHHPRVRVPSSAIFDSLDIDRSFEIYRDRFGDASDFTFYLVGSFSLDSIRPLVEQWLGGLPGRHRVERARDLGIRPPRGVVRRVVRAGMEPKALTQLVFTGPMHFSLENVATLDLLADVMRIRLREALREELSGTYGVNVQAGSSDVPVPSYTVALGFGSNPDRVPELVRAAMREIDSLRTAGPTADEMAKVREEEIRERETDARTNQFWAVHLMSYDQNGWPIERIADYTDWVAGVTAEELRDAARRYLDPRNVVQLSLVPEGPTAEAGNGTELPSGLRVW